VSARSYRLASLDLASPFDQAAGRLAIPADITDGFDPALSLVEGGYRQPTSICRFIHTTGLLVVQLDQRPRGALRVEILLRSDLIADERWDQRAERRAEGRAVRGLPTDGLERAADRRHRLVAVSAQGRTRAYVLLALGEGEDAATRHRLTLEVEPAEFDESGLLLLGFDAARQGDSWAVTPGLPDPIVGIGVRRLGIVPAYRTAPVSVSTGLRAEDGWFRYEPRVGYAVVNPPTADAPVRVEIRRVHPGGRIAGRLARMRASAPVLEAERIDGGTLTVEGPRSGSHGTFWFDLPAGTGPVRLRFAQEGGDPPLLLRGTIPG
jgi:hypothetical protein